MKFLKKTKGITLVALIVTIIILLILAGITISQLTGSGLFENAKLAKEKYENAQTKEDEILNKYENLINTGKISSDRDIDIQQLKNQLKKEIMSEINTSGGNPTGTIISYIAGTSAPTGYLKCDGTVYNIADYKVLADEIKNGFGKYDYWGGDGETTFAVPNLQGEFLRGYSTGSTDSKAEGITTEDVGKHQEPTKHTGGFGWTNGRVYMGYNSGNESINADFTESLSKRVYSGVGAKESLASTLYTSRPTNTSVLYCIKY